MHPFAYARPATVSDALALLDEHGPGVKGMSEGALLCVAPAVAAAVREATGAVIRDLPLTPQRVWQALQERDQERRAEPAHSEPVRAEVRS